MDLSRRRFLGGTAASAWWATSAARTRALDETARRASSIEGTTLSVTVVRPNGPGYVKLREGPGWPTVVRSELRELDTARDTRRRAVAAFAHLTDVHLIDAQSPGRVEFLDGLGEPFSGAYRPQETLTTQVQASMVQRLVDLQRAPITGRRLDCAVSTGDNIDNCQHNELDWFIGVLDGGTVTANSGDLHRYEGVQATEWGDARYWHPDGGIADTYLAAGFPTVPGLLDAAIAPHRSPGLDIAWYSTYGNHDGLIQGNVPRSDAFDELLVADFKITDLPHGVSAVTFLAEAIGDTAAIRRRVADGSMPHQTVTPDPQRRSLTTQDWVHAHLASTHRPSPAGHGYTEDHLDGRPLSYRFEIAPGVVGISMDTGGYNSGSIGGDQLRFLEATLSAVHSRSFDSSGGEVRSGNDDQLVVLFSHFTSETMTGAPPDPSHPGERRIEGEELVAFLHRWPNLVAWVNGHTHTNEVRPMPDRSGRTGGFWQITTASHVDFPEHARIVELVDNDDGTMSIFATMVEHAAPIVADYDDLSPLGLASISRELSANGEQAAAVGHLGAATSLNVELGLAAPFDLRRAGLGAPTTAPARRAGPVSGTDDDMPVGTLVGAGVATAAAVAGGAIALRRRREGAATAGERGLDPADQEQTPWR